MKISFEKLPEVINDTFYPLLWDDKALEVIVGGANSGKSYFISQKIIYKMIAEKGHRFLACRKVKKDVRHSCYDMLKATIHNFGFDDLFKYNDTETIITCTLNGNDIIGVGLDDVNKLKSFYDPTDYWAEEADQMTPDDIMQLNLRLRGNTTFVKQGMLTMNPIWAGHWIKKTYFDTPNPDMVTTHRSTYRDNRFLDEATKQKMEAITDPYYKQVYVNGDWGVYGNRVFTNYVIEDFDYKEDDLENIFTGMDFGYAHAAAIERGGFKDGDMYIFDELYGKGWENVRFIKAAKEYFGEAGSYFSIVADSAEPDRIAEWNNSGFHVEAAIKGPGSLGFGIDFLCSFKIHVHKTKCPNLANEIQTFSRKEKDGEATEVFVEVNDDAIAACLSGDTIVNTKDGDFRIKDLVGKEGEVYSFNGIEPSLERFDSVSLTRYSKIVYTIELEDGGIIEATEEHPILTSRGWVEVRNLKEDDEVVQIGTD